MRSISSILEVPPRFDAVARLAVDPSFLITTVAFTALFARPVSSLASDWINDPESGLGLLLAPLALWLAWRKGVRADAKPLEGLGVPMLAVAVLLRYASALAAELFTMRMSAILALVGLTTYYLGFRQVLRWWVPFALLVLAIPLPAIVLNAIALPLQLKASHIGAGLLEWRRVPVHLAGNVIRIPGHELFVATACSGLRSLSALVSLGLLLGDWMLRFPVSRLWILAAAIPVAIVINGVRLFLTAFLMNFVSADYGQGFLHFTEGWLLFLVAFAVLWGMTGMVAAAEQAATRWAQ